MNQLWEKIKLKNLKSHRTIILIISAAFLLRLFITFRIGDFFWDEIFSFVYSQKTWGESWKLWLLETNPPLHMIFLKIWFFFLPATEFTARLFSVSVGTATVFLIYRLGQNFFNEKIALISAITLTLLPYHIFLSVYARAYALLLFLSVLSVFFFLKIFNEESAPKKYYIFLSLANLLLLFTHLTGFWIVLAEFICLLKNRKILKKFFIYQMSVGALWIAWLIPSLMSKMTDPTNLGSAWFFNFDKNPLNIFIPLKLIFFGPAAPWISILAIILFCLSGIYLLKQKNTTLNFKKNLGVILVIFFLPIVAIAILNIWNIKFIATILPFFCLIVGYILSQINKKYLISLLIILFFCLPGVCKLTTQTPINKWEKLNHTVDTLRQTEKKEVIVVANFNTKLLFDRYFHLYIPIKYCLKSEVNAQDYARENYLNYPRKLEDITDWYNVNQLAEYERIFVFEDEDYGIYFTKILEQQGWEKKEKNQDVPADVNTLYVYEKN